MAPFANFAPRLARFRRDDSGNVAILTALCALPLIVAACGSVDVLRMTSTQERLQIMLDSATLAAAALSQSGDMEDVVDAYMDANLPDGTAWNTLSYTTKVLEDTESSRELEVTASVTLKTPFLSLIGMSSQTVNAKSVAVQSQTDIEISMVLDISSSMSGAKVADLRSASKSFIDLMLAGDLVDHTSINLIPFGGTVNIGADLFDELAVPVASDSSNVDPSDVNYAPADTIPHSVFRFTHGNTCIEYTNSDYNLLAIPSGSRPQVPNFTRYGAKNDWCPRSDTEALFNSNSASDLKDRIDDMTLSDGTGLDIGVMWGAKALSPSLKGDLGGDFTDRPADFDDDGTMKVAIIMTDGAITGQDRPVSPASAEKPHILNNADRQKIVVGGGTDVDSSTSYNATAYFKRICEALRANSVVVYTIGYQIAGGSDPDTLMKYCASTPSNYYHVDAFDLDSAFNGIAASINSLRISG
ncbi:pilus assembly protein TadG-related protein [Roseibium sp.]|uniref:pilus assembly protein TadG-related protein n=1 Tax=Roseibium sp. TaxID=1936156 RepID=UPI003BA96E39